ncbi:hypothetical protein FKM82_030061 [Ascaphus truei]
MMHGDAFFPPQCPAFISRRKRVNAAGDKTVYTMYDFTSPAKDGGAIQYKPFPPRRRAFRHGEKLAKGKPRRTSHEAAAFKCNGLRGGFVQRRDGGLLQLLWAVVGLQAQARVL